MLEQSSSAEALGRPQAWAKRRAQLARYLLRTGEPAQAYRIAARHQLTAGSDYADLEFIAGFIALRKLGDAPTALRHFRHLEQAVATPISLSRAAYWQGRALEAMGDPAATDAYRAAARHQTAYYGQLAAERLGQSLDPALLEPLQAADWRQAGFAKLSVLEAALLLLKAGDRTLAKRFILHLAEPLSASDRASLAALRLRVNDPHIAVLLAKQAAERGQILPQAYFPLADLVPEDGLSVSRALALAIARRESEFDPAARSKAGARGLMQVMPETAERMARETGLPFTLSRLTTDPGYKDLAHQGLAVALPLGKGTFGISGDRFGYSLYNETKVSAAYAMRFGEGLRASVQVNYLGVRLGENYGSASAFAAEGGMQARLTDALWIGAHVYNPIRVKIGGPYDDRIPTLLRAGFGYTFSKKLLMTLEAEKDIDQPERMRMGMEYHPNDVLYLRTGITTGPAQGHFGAGFRLKRVDIDLAVAVRSQLGTTPIIGLNYRFE